MKHLKNSLVVFAGLLVVVGVVTSIGPSLSKGMSTDLPKSAISVRVLTGNNPITILSGRDPEGTSYAVTSLTVANYSGSIMNLLVTGGWGATEDCISFSGEHLQKGGPDVIVPAGETVHLSFPQPFILSARPGAAACLNVITSHSSSVTVVGYRF